MSALFDGSTSYLINSAPNLSATGYPLTGGAWFKPNAAPAVGQGIILEYSDTGASPPIGRFDIRLSTTSKLGLFARDGTTAATGSTTTSVTLGGWHFVIARWISLTNRRMTVLFPDGAIEHVQNTTSINPSGIDALYIGALPNFGSTPSDFFNGAIGEWWIADADVQADGAQLNTGLLRQLAYSGPFSVPHISRNIVEYHAMRSSLPNARTNFEEHYYKRSFQTWSNTAVTLAPHPPLPYSNETDIRALPVMI